MNPTALATASLMMRRISTSTRGQVHPQVRELLTQYGDIGLIWFDTPCP